jgi:hypothetical protein
LSDQGFLFALHNAAYADYFHASSTAEILIRSTSFVMRLGCAYRQAVCGLHKRAPSGPSHQSRQQSQWKSLPEPCRETGHSRVPGLFSELRREPFADPGRPGLPRLFKAVLVTGVEEEAGHQALQLQASTDASPGPTSVFHKCVSREIEPKTRKIRCWHFSEVNRMSA